MERAHIYNQHVRGEPDPKLRSDSSDRTTDVVSHSGPPTHYETFKGSMYSTDRTLSLDAWANLHTVCDGYQIIGTNLLPYIIYRLHFIILFNSTHGLVSQRSEFSNFSTLRVELPHTDRSGLPRFRISPPWKEPVNSFCTVWAFVSRPQRFSSRQLGCSFTSGRKAADAVVRPHGPVFSSLITWIFCMMS